MTRPKLLKLLIASVRSRPLLVLYIILSRPAVTTADVPRHVDRQGQITATEAITVAVGPATWRFVLEQLDDVYTNDEVSPIRREAMQEFAEAMAASDRLESWEQRSAARTSASHALLLHLQTITQIRTDSADPETAQEAALAFLEGLVALGRFDSAMKSAEAFLKDEHAPAALRAQAYRLAIRAALGANDRAAAAQFRRRFAEELPAEARFESPTALPFGPIRVAVYQFRQAQVQDDLALQYRGGRHADPQLAKRALQLRDAARESAVMTLRLRG